jgi:hypothetical protein
MGINIPRILEVRKGCIVGGFIIHRITLLLMPMIIVLMMIIVMVIMIVDIMMIIFLLLWMIIFFLLWMIIFFLLLGVFMFLLLLHLTMEDTVEDTVTEEGVTLSSNGTTLGLTERGRGGCSSRSDQRHQYCHHHRDGH